MKVIKRNGSEVIFDITKIIVAVSKANDSVEEADRMTPVQIRRIAESVELQCQRLGRTPTVEEIQDMVEHQIMAHGAFEVAKHYITYRYTRSLVRRSNTTDDRILALLESSIEPDGQLPAGNGRMVNAAQRDYIAGEVSRDLTSRILLPEDIVEAHNEGILHFHDTGYYAQHMHNCTLVNLADMLENGTVINGTRIERPRSFATACTVATQIAAQVASNQYGGQTISLAHLAPFVQVSREKLRRSVRESLAAAGAGTDDKTVDTIAERQLRQEVRRGVQTIQYQLLTLVTTNGQAPLVAAFLHLGEARDEQEREDLALIARELLLQRRQGVQNEQGKSSAPILPQLLYVLEESNLRPDGHYRYLTELAAACITGQTGPVFLSEAQMKERAAEAGGERYCYPPMGPRALLTPYSDEYDRPLAYGRFNQGVVTLNLADAALSSGGSIQRFRQIMEERLELCHRALLCRHERLKGTLSDAAPILWQYGACARLKPGQAIDRLLYGGRSTLSLGYAGLYECVLHMTGRSPADPSATPFALEIMGAMGDACRRWTAQHNIAFTLYGTPPESISERFVRCLRRRFGAVEGITDRPGVSDSCCLPEDASGDVLQRLALEAQFQQFASGGGLSRAELADPSPESVMALLQALYDSALCVQLCTKEPA
ncbi:MAG: anaerobic ribonucleoside-triphosphate reductase [Ruminococcaceae bacterium]|nr:anaerobic ribonucleoside-triphosphate reductase [Oscillospiraceae bacterium]